MTSSTSAVAVCCCSDSVRSSVRWRSSLSRRVFSIAMTACFAKLLNKLNLLVGEGPNFLTKDGDSSNQVIILQHRHDNDRANAAKLDGVDYRRNALGIRSCRCKVGGLDRPLGSDQLGKVATRGGMDRTASARLGKCPRHIVAGDDAQCTTFMEIEVAKLGLANAHCIGQHGVEHWLELAG